MNHPAPKPSSASRSVLQPVPRPARLLLLAMAMLSLLGGVLAGLARFAWDVPNAAITATGWHGALMISAFFGAVISLERAVALERRWAYLAPACAGLSGILLLAGAPVAVAQGLSLLAAATLVAASAQVLRRLIAPFTLVLALAALCWLIGALVWSVSGTISAAVPWWLGFLVLTIAGERLELTRFLPTPPLAQRMFMVIVGVVLAGSVLSLWREAAGLQLFSAGLLALAIWLLRYDIARHNAKQKGLTRFIALCLLSGYLWLMVAAAIGLSGGLMPGHSWRDAALHSVGLGFVFAMVFGHAPIIFPAVARVKIPYHPVLYLPLLVLHSSLALRIFGGLNQDFAWQRSGALLNAFALLLFVLTLLSRIFFGKKEST